MSHSSSRVSQKLATRRSSDNWVLGLKGKKGDAERSRGGSMESFAGAREPITPTTSHVHLLRGETGGLDLYIGGIGLDES